MNDMSVFSFEGNEIRTELVGGNPMFCATDVAKILGFKNPTQAVKDHCKGLRKSETFKNGGWPASIICESDVYRLVMRSTLPSAERFQDWVVEEVLPSIRNNGGYIANQENETPEMIMAKALMVAQSVIDQKELALRNAEQKITGLENLFHNGGTIAQFVKQLNGVNSMQMNHWLYENTNWLYDENKGKVYQTGPKAGQPKPIIWRCASYARDKYLTESNYNVDRQGMDSMVKYEVQLLADGKKWIYNKYVKGLLPMKKTWNGSYTHEKDLV